MTTKKQRHEAVMVRREQWLADRRESGLKAQKADQEYREQKKREAARSTHDKKHSWKKIDNDCILCQDLLEAQKQESRKLESSSSG